MGWKTLNNSPVCSYATYASGKVGHVYELPEQWPSFKAFFDGIYLGAHEDFDSAATAVNSLGGTHGG